MQRVFIDPMRRVCLEISNGQLRQVDRYRGSLPSVRSLPLSYLHLHVTARSGLAITAVVSECNLDSDNRMC